MKRKVDWEEEKQSEREDYSDEEGVEEEPESKMFWTIIPKPFPESVLPTCCTSEYGHIQRYLVLDAAWALTTTSALNSSDKHLRTSRICVTSA